MIDAILSGGTIIDGTGRPRYATDIGIVGERIALIGDLHARETVRRVDCRDTVLAPGFIDACSHTGAGWLTLPKSPSNIAQGVTTAIAGACGRSPFFNGVEWTNTDEFFGAISRCGLGPNDAMFVGYDDALTTGDARAAIRSACEAGAIGASFDTNALTRDELAACMREAAAAGAARAAVHLGSNGTPVLDALEDAIVSAQLAGVALHVSHHQVTRTQHGLMERTLERIDRARTHGTDVTVDCYPYVATWIDLADLLPESVRNSVDTIELLDDPAAAAAIAMETHARLGDRWNDVMLAEVGGEANMGWCGMRMDEIAQQRRLSPARALIELVRQEGRRARAFFFTLSEDDIAMMLSAEFTAIGTDAAALAADSVIFGTPHPRVFGTFPRVIGRFVRGRSTLTLEEAVRRMTSLPARAFGLSGRGTIAEGAYADITIFNEAAFVDTATYERGVSFPKGLAHVFVNGVAVVSGGAATNAQPGRLLRGGE